MKIKFLNIPISFYVVSKNHKMNRKETKKLKR